MPSASPPTLKRSRQESIAIATVIVLLFLMGVLTWRSFRDLQRSRLIVRHTYEIILTLERIESAMKDAESRQRGFVITGRDEYLEPFDEGAKQIDGLIEQAKTLTEGDVLQHERIAPLESRIAERIGELRTAIAAPREGGVDAAQIAADNDVRKLSMDRIHAAALEMQNVENKLLVEREIEARNSYRSGLFTSVISTIIELLMVGALLYLLQRNRNQAERAASQVQAEKENLRVTLASIGDGVIATDLMGRVTSLNPIAEILTGWTNEGAQGELLTNVFRIINESTRLPVDNPALRALADGTIVGLANHTILIAKDGTERPIDDSAAPIRDADGNVFGSVLVFRDISKRQQEAAQIAERHRLIELRADTSFACSLAHKTPEALQQTCEAVVKHLDVAFARVWTLGETSDILELQASAGMYTHLDGPHSRVPVGQYKIGRIASHRLPHLSNSVLDDPEVSDHDWAQREGMVAFAGYPLLVENRVVGVLAMFSRSILSDGILLELQPIADFVAQFIDRRNQEARRTEAQAKLKASEERVRMALDSAELGTWHIDPQTQALTTDSRFREIFGRADEPLTYAQAVACLHIDDRLRVEAAIAAAIDPVIQHPTTRSTELCSQMDHTAGSLRKVAQTTQTQNSSALTAP